MGRAVPRGLHGAEQRSQAGCSSSWRETIVIDINPGFSFASSGLLLKRDPRAEPSQPHRASPLLPPSHANPVLGRGAHHRAARGRCPSHQDHLVARAACPRLAGSLFITLPVTRLEEEELTGPWGEGASLWPASPCQPRAKGTVRGVSDQLLLGKTTPAQWKAGSSPLRPCWLCPRQPRAWLGWPGVSMLPTSPLCPTTPYVPPAKEPPMWRAAATLTVSSLREQ